MSIVLCAYNSEQVIARALESLLAQDYPADLYEIIVVNDGSNDNTAQIVAEYPVRLVSHAANLGRGAARNTGLDYIKGDVYVCFDDDCVADPNWLRQLAAGYRQQHVAGVGSSLKTPAELRGIASRFMVATRISDPPSLRLGASKHPLRRFAAYFADQLNPGQSSADVYRVRELYGASASFPAEVLRTVGGWDTSLRAMEDRDICARIAEAHPGLGFYAVSAARITHDPGMSLFQLLRKAYVRGPDNLRHYRRSNLTPPVFPFPAAWLAGTAIAAVLNPVSGLLAAVTLPQLLYPWWPLRAARERSPRCLLFAYVQLATESVTVIGLLRGELVLRGQDRRDVNLDIR
jgi:glycosyltransferase involved in cell wall biosynthesis